MVNRSIGNLLRYLAGDKPMTWDLMLTQYKFSYNAMSNKSTGKSHIEIFYGYATPMLLDRTFLFIFK